MATNKFITLEQLDQTTQALLYKINEKADTKVDIENVNAILDSGVKIATIDEVDIYAPDGLQTSDLATVAMTGSYTDLSNKPTIPSKTSELTNDSGFITSNDIPTKTSDLTNDSGFITSSDVDTSTFMVKGTDYVTAGQKSGTTLGTLATAEGYATTASGNFSHAEGGSTKAIGNNSHAEGSNTNASGNFSHAEGMYSAANGDSSHAEGYATAATGIYSHSEGYWTIAQTKSQHAFGEYNIADPTGSTTTRGTYIEIVGNGALNGTTPVRSNARTLDWFGNEVLAGKLTMGAGPTANMDAATKQYVDTSITTAIGGINQFEVAIVSDLPTTNIDTHTIYFKSNSSSGNNVYDEYMYINNNWELIGSTQIDLTPYARTADLATVATTGSYADLLNAPAAETDANVEDMLDSFDLDYTSNTLSPNMWQGGSY